MTKQEIIQDETLFQRACGLWVERNIGQCVSSLMYDVGRNLEECSRIFDFDYDEALGWFQREDYSEVVSDFIDDADLDDLETIADMVGDWEEILDEAGVSTKEEEDFVGPTSEHLDQIRTKVKALITNDSEYAEIGRHFSLDPDYDEVYEHYLCDDYAASVLKSHGETVFEFANLCVWARTTTGQSASIDRVVRTIVRGLDDDHYIFQQAR